MFFREAFSTTLRAGEAFLFFIYQNLLTLLKKLELGSVAGTGVVNLSAIATGYALDYTGVEKLKDGLLTEKGRLSWSLRCPPLNPGVVVAYVSS